MKIVYLIAGTYRPAGMERVLAQKANWFAARANEIVIVTTDQRSLPPAFELDSSIRCVDLGINYELTNGASFLAKFFSFPAKHRLHRRRLAEFLFRERPDITVSMFCNDADFLPKIKDGSRKVLEVHFSAFKRMQYGRKGLWAIADRILSCRDHRTARHYDKFVVLTQEDALNWDGVPGIEVIPNGRPFTFDSPATLDSRQIIAVGRYTHQKGFDRLLEAWKKMGCGAADGWTLRLAGEGDELPVDLPDNVITGPSIDIKREYLDSSILVSTSRYEGLPMVMLEAQAAGLPIVAYACQCGPKDIVTDGEDGYLVEDGDVNTLIDRLKTLMHDDTLRKRMGAAAYRNSDNFDREAIMQRWNTLFEELCGQ